MKAVLCKAWGPPETLVVEDLPSPAPGKGRVLVAVHAAGVNFPDVLIIQNKYQLKPELPFSPGSEIAGVVKRVGEGVHGFMPGDPVMALIGWGGFAEEVLVDEAKLAPMPAGMDYTVAASFGVTYATSYHALKDRARLAPGETLLVLGAAGGVGLAAVDVGKLLGATVIAAAGSQDKLAVCTRMGADHVIDYTKGFRDQVKALTADRGADVIYDPVGGDVTDESMRCIAPFGRLLIVGFTGGRPAQLRANHLLIKDAEAIGFTIGALARLDPAREKKNLSILLGWLGAGRIHPHVSHALPLEQAAEALALVRDRKVIGKAVLV